MAEILIPSQKRKIEYEPGQSLMRALLDKDIFIDNPCNGKGTCGKCRVQVLAGNVSPLSQTELALLREEEIALGIRLSCLCFPRGNVTVEVLQEEKEHRVLTKGLTPEFTFCPEVELRQVLLRKPSLEEQIPFEEQVLAQLDCGPTSISALQKGPWQEGSYTATLHRGSFIDLEESCKKKRIYGVAVDIGTTTVVTSLIDLQTGEETANEARINAQKHYGLDVLTRITYELENERDGIVKLQQAIVSSLDEMILRMCEKANVGCENIYEISVSANCTMLHMLLGVNASSIGVAPFAPVFVRSRYLRADAIGITSAKKAALYVLPSVSAYIGADIVAGALVCGLDKAKTNVLFIDIGTNGEIVLASGGKLLSCSCAAGPALEGMNISSGMRAAEGAVEDVKISENGVKLDVIGGGTAAGLCGSGILAAIRELIRIGMIERSGTFIKPQSLESDDYRRKLFRSDGKKRTAVLSEKLYITQNDIRQVQLAKGAILSGFYALLKKAGISMEELDEVLIAGQFGAHLPAESLTGTGILPPEITAKIRYVGNSSKIGAYMALMSGRKKREMESLAQKIDYMELGASPGYERLFSSCLLFPKI